VVDVRERHFGSIIGPGPDAGVADVGALLRRLLLFEDCTLQSLRLRELRPMLDVFGYDGVRALLKSPDFHVLYDARTFGSIPAELAGGQPIPPGIFRLAAMRESPDVEAGLAPPGAIPDPKRARGVSVGCSTRLARHWG